MLRYVDGKIYLAITKSDQMEITQDMLIELKENTRRRNLLVDYPNVRHPVQVRELFIRIYDQLGFRILRSDESFPNYVLSFDNKQSVRAHVVVDSADFINGQYPCDECDLVICWQNTLSDQKDFDILELKPKFDLFGHYLNEL